MDESAFPCTAVVVAVAAAAPTVQIVNKVSSDQLLCKFADNSPPPKTKKKRMLNRSKRVKRRESGDLQTLLPPAFEARRRSSSSTAMVRKLGIGRGRAFKTKSVLGDVLRKTWTRTVEGASRVFMEKHYKHKLLIHDSAIPLGV